MVQLGTQTRGEAPKILRFCKIKALNRPISGTFKHLFLCFWCASVKLKFKVELNILLIAFADTTYRKNFM